MVDNGNSMAGLGLALQHSSRVDSMPSCSDDSITIRQPAGQGVNGARMYTRSRLSQQQQQQQQQQEFGQQEQEQPQHMLRQAASKHRQQPALDDSCWHTPAPSDGGNSYPATTLSRVLQAQAAWTRQAGGSSPFATVQSQNGPAAVCAASEMLADFSPLGACTPRGSRGLLSPFAAAFSEANSIGGASAASSDAPQL
jgi:hypothetical protein